MSNIAFTKSRLMMGIKFEKNIKIDSYGGAEMRVHAVPDAGLAEIQGRLDYGIFDAIRDMTNMGLSESDVGNLVDNKTSPDTIKKLANLTIPANLFKYMIALCEKGIIPVPDPECPKCHGQPGQGVCPVCDIREDVDKFIGFATLEIGAVIIGMSIPNWQEVEDFFSQRKAASSPESSPNQA